MKAARFAAAAAVATAALVLIPAGPASAVNPSTTISSPGNGATLTNSTVPISGSTSIPPGLLNGNTITGVAISVTGASTASCSNSGCGATVGGTSTSFSFHPVLAFNGPYTVTANTSASEAGILGSTPRSDSASASFRLAVPPAAPHGVSAVANADRSVTVSWARNTEPDILGYQVERQDPSSSQLSAAANVAQPAGGSSVSWT
ncbi:MAG: hypothetical protein M3N98_01275, partial [Actinomycetota bacterium]|nr:hypothetical protein [Actinomycetota bacterium]